MTTAVHLERQGRVATLVIARPPLNILDIPTTTALNAALDGLAADPDLQLLFLEGAGERAFSAGVSVQDHARDTIGAMLDGLHGAVRRLRDLPAVAVAVVRGHCLGGGMELAMACDLVLAADDARFGQPEIELGCFPPVAAALYPGRLGRQRALELLLTGRTLSAEEAERLGLVTWHVPAADLAAERERIATLLIGKSAAVTRLIKRAVRTGEALPFGPALEAIERLYLDELPRTEDMDEGIAAFLEKRRPVWRHR